MRQSPAVDSRPPRVALPSLVDEDDLKSPPSRTDMSTFGRERATIASGGSPLMRSLPSLVVVSSTDPTKVSTSFALTDAVEFIGRSRNCRIRLCEHGISRLHAKVFL